MNMVNTKYYYVLVETRFYKKIKKFKVISRIFLLPLFKPYFHVPIGRDKHIFVRMRRWHSK